MLHSKLAMTRGKFFSCLLVLTISLFTTIFVQAQEGQEPILEISSPLPGEVAQGLLQIVGTIEVADLDSFILEFSFQQNNDQAWFAINKGNIVIVDGILGEWETSTIPDGNYKLRLTVNRNTDGPLILVVEGIRVRNYSQIETNTPIPTNEIPTTIPTSVSTITISPTAELKPSPTPFNPNPASVTFGDIQKRILQGAIGGLVIFTIFLLYRSSRNRK